MDLTTYENYFKAIVDNSKVLKSFYHIDMLDEFDSFISDLRSNKFATPMLVLESYSLSTIAQKADNLHDNFDGALLILDRFDVRVLTKTEKTKFLTEKEYICKQIRRLMMNNYMKHHPLLTGLQPESIKLEKTETIAGTYKGYRMSFVIEAPDNEPLNPDFWINT